MSSDQSQVLPPVTSRHLHRSFGKFSEDPIPGKGSQKYTESIPAWNDNDYDRAFKLLTEAIAEGLDGFNRSCAHSSLAEIYLIRGELGKAVKHFLECLAIPDRESFSTWQSAMKLYYIYNAVGRPERRELYSLAKEANKRHDVAHAPGVEEEIRTLAQRKGFK